MKRYPRVAFFTDSYHETNGVAQTGRQLEAFARREQLPFLSAALSTLYPALRAANQDPVKALSYE